MAGQVTVRLRDRASGVLSAPVAVGYDIATGGITTGAQITRTNVGSTAETYTTVQDLVTHTNGEDHEGLRIVGQLNVKHDVTLTNCLLDGVDTAGGAGYTLKHTLGAGKLAILRHCTIITRAAITKGVVLLGAGALLLEDCKILGGEDGIFAKPEGSRLVPGTGVALVVRRSWVGDLQGHPGSHADGIQLDGALSGALIDMCNVEGFQLAPGGVPGTDVADGSILSNSAVTGTQQSTNPMQLRNVTVTRSRMVGGGYSLSLAPQDGLPVVDATVTDNRFGLVHQFGPLTVANGSTVSGNVWDATGTTSRGLHVTAGQPII